MLLEQFADFMVLILLAAAVVAGVIGEPQDSAAIVVIVVVNAVLGFVQEYRAEHAMAALNALATPHAHVRRAGVARNVETADVVPGDLVLLEAGTAVPADLRLIDAVQLRIDESALTGESEPVDKITAALADPDLGIGDRRNMAYRGTLATNGRGLGVAVATGMRTEVGRIAALLQSEEIPPTPLQQRLTLLGKQLALAVLAISAMVFGIGLLHGEEPLLMLLTALSLAVAAMPEALPAVVTVSLALGARTMVAQRALVRRLSPTSAPTRPARSPRIACASRRSTWTVRRSSNRRPTPPGGSRGPRCSRRWRSTTMPCSRRRTTATAIPRKSPCSPRRPAPGSRRRHSPLACLASARSRSLRSARG
jgi:Ca2+-transporting ATPase